MAEDTYVGNALSRVGWAGQTDKWAANRRNAYIQEVDQYLAQHPEATPELASFLQNQPDFRVFDFLTKSIATGVEAPTTPEEYREMAAFAAQQRSDANRYGSSGLGNIASGLDDIWAGTEGDYGGIRHIVGAALLGGALSSAGAGASAAGAGSGAGATAGAGSGAAAGTGAGVTAGQVGTGVSALSAGDALLSGGDSGSTTTSTGGMPTTNPITGESQQSGTGTFGTGQGSSVSTGGSGFFDSIGNWISSPSGQNTLGSALSIGSNLYGASQAQAGIDAATAEARRQFDIGQANVAPWMQAGRSALGEQLDLMGLPGGTTGGTQTALERLRNTPGYEWRKSQGERGLEASSAARGGITSGKAATSLLKYGQDYASNEYANRLSQLGNLSGTGQQQANLMSGAGERLGSTLGQSALTSGALNQSSTLGIGNTLGNWLQNMNQSTLG